jgi:hypothetical protein
MTVSQITPVPSLKNAGVIRFGQDKEPKASVAEETPRVKMPKGVTLEMIRAMLGIEDPDTMDLRSMARSMQEDVKKKPISEVSFADGKWQFKWGGQPHTLEIKKVKQGLLISTWDYTVGNDTYTFDLKGQRSLGLRRFVETGSGKVTFNLLVDAQRAITLESALMSDDALDMFENLEKALKKALHKQQ